MLTVSKTNIAIAILALINAFLYLQEPRSSLQATINESNATTSPPKASPATAAINPASNLKAYDDAAISSIVSAPTHPRIRKGSFLETSIRKAKDLKLNFSRLIDIDFEYLITPKCREDLLLIVVVSSKPSNDDKRQSIRDTWGRPKNVMQVVFTLGVDVNDTKNTNITEENNIHRDIVQGSFVDSYRNLTYKHMMSLQWVTEFCHSKPPRFVLKTDDDTFVHYQELIWFLNREFYDWGDKYAMACALSIGVPVIRKETDFWFVTFNEYSAESYPPFCSGSFIIYAPEVLPLLIQESLTTKYFYVDDVYVTGFLMEKLNLTQMNIEYLFLSSQNLHELLTRGPAQTGTFLSGPMNADVLEMYWMWKVTQDFHRKTGY